MANRGRHVSVWFELVVNTAAEQGGVESLPDSIGHKAGMDASRFMLYGVREGPGTPRGNQCNNNKENMQLQQRWDSNTKL